MIIDIPKLREEGEWLEGEEPAAILDLDSLRGVRARGGIRYRFFVQPVSGKLVVKGEMGLDLEFECSRCADFFSTTLRDLSFLRAYDIAGGVEAVDVTQDIREDILLELPAFPVCRTDCQGLCPRCGKNLNHGPCGCRPGEESRWGSLDGLKLD